MSPCVLDGGVPVHIGQEAQTEAVRIVRRICEAIDDDARLGGIERLPDATVQLVVDHGAPVLGFLVRNRMHACACECARQQPEGWGIRSGWMKTIRTKIKWERLWTSIIVRDKLAAISILSLSVPNQSRRTRLISPQGLPRRPSTKR